MAKRYKARFYMKSGTVITCKFKELNVKWDSTGFTSVNWQTGDGKDRLAGIALSEIEAVVFL